MPFFSTPIQPFPRPYRLRKSIILSYLSYYTSIHFSVDPSGFLFILPIFPTISPVFIHSARSVYVFSHFSPATFHFFVRVLSGQSVIVTSVKHPRWTVHNRLRCARVFVYVSGGPRILDISYERRKNCPLPFPATRTGKSPNTCRTRINWIPARLNSRAREPSARVAFQRPSWHVTTRKTRKSNGLARSRSGSADRTTLGSFRRGRFVFFFIFFLPTRSRTATFRAPRQRRQTFPGTPLSYSRVCDGWKPSPVESYPNPRPCASVFYFSSFPSVQTEPISQWRIFGGGRMGHSPPPPTWPV